MKKSLFVILCAFLMIAPKAQVRIGVSANKPGVKMSQDLIGAFFEDINYGADGGLYAELVQNRSFEYFANGVVNEGPLAHWSLVQGTGTNASYEIENTNPLNGNNRNYLKISINNAGAKIGVTNSGYFGMHIVGKKNYKFSAYLRRNEQYKGSVEIQLLSFGGSTLVKKTIDSLSTDWKKYSFDIPSSVITLDNVSLGLFFSGSGVVYADMVSFFPEETFKNRPNGLRKDLAQAVADMKPKFLRFPGGCISHGFGLDNAYRWKHTIGDVAERKPNWNLWGYHQTYGLGFYEYFLYCEDIGAKPLPVLPIGISCQFRPREIEPIEKMGPWIQDAVDLIEFANGDTSTTWGRKRAQMGHPQPFNLEYLCLGNEEDDIPEFRTRFIMFQDTLRKYHPEIKILGTSGPFADGAYYNSLWDFSKQQHVDAVDEHYYVDPSWLLANNHRYDNFDRNGPKVFIGEWASRDDRLFNAICEAAYLTGAERNADVVQFTCYAPLFNYMEAIPYHWHPDMILFNNSSVVKTANYYVQQLYGVHAGDEYIPGTVTYEKEYNSVLGLNGKVGVGSWATQVSFDDVKVASGNKVWINEGFSATSPNWTVQGGTFSTSQGQYNQTSSAVPAWSVNTTVVDTSVYTITLKAMKTGGNEGFLIPFAFQDTQNYYWLNIGGWGNTQHALEKSTNGVKTQLTTTPGSISNNVWYTIRVEVNQSYITCYLNDKLLFKTAQPVTGPVTASITKDYETNDLIMKLVNSSARAIDASINISDIGVSGNAALTVLTGAPDARNSIENPNSIKPVESSIAVSNNFDYQLPAYSMNVIRVKMNTLSSRENYLKEGGTGLNQLKISPNPSVDYSHISLANMTNFSSVILCDLNGNVVRQYAHVTGDSIVIERGNLPAGTYIIKARDANRVTTGKIIFTDDRVAK